MIHFMYWCLIDYLAVIIAKGEGAVVAHERFLTAITEMTES